LCPPFVFQFLRSALGLTVFLLSTLTITEKSRADSIAKSCEFNFESLTPPRWTSPLLQRNILTSKRGVQVSSFSSWPSEIELRVVTSETAVRDDARPFSQRVFAIIPPSVSKTEAAARLSGFFRRPQSDLYDRLRTATVNQTERVVDLSSLFSRWIDDLGKTGVCRVNCFNFAMRVSGRAILPMYLTAESATTRLRLFFENVDLQTDSLKFGDLVAVWRDRDVFGARTEPGYANSLAHLAIYIGGDLVVQKDGPRGPYMISRLSPNGIPGLNGPYNGVVSVHRRR